MKSCGRLNEEPPTSTDNPLFEREREVRRDKFCTEAISNVPEKLFDERSREESWPAGKCGIVPLNWLCERSSVERLPELCTIEKIV